METNEFIPVSMGARSPLLACPRCGDTAIHPVQIECISPGRATGRVRIDSDGINIDPMHQPVGRGVHISLVFGCENGHAFKYCLHFHKGSTTVDRIVSDENQHNWWTTIWRD